MGEEEEMTALPVSSGNSSSSQGRNETLLGTQVNMDLSHMPAVALEKLVTHLPHPFPELTLWDPWTPPYGSKRP